LFAIPVSDVDRAKAFYFSSDPDGNGWAVQLPPRD
jgi:hypothetical protein